MVKRKTTKPTRRMKKASRPATRVKPKPRKSTRLTKGPRYSHDDPSLRTGDGGFTVWTLQEMAQGKRFDELNNLFNNGLTMDALPVGYAAGAAVPVLDPSTKVVAEALNYLNVDSRYFKVGGKQLIDDTLDSLVGRGWRGKVFFQSNNKRISKGRNRMREFLVLPNSSIVPMNKFDTMLLDSHPLASGANRMSWF